MTTFVQVAMNYMMIEHHKLIEQLEMKYANHINQLLQQKACIHQSLQQMLYSKLHQLVSTHQINLTQQNHVETPTIANIDIYPIQSHNTNNDENDEHNNKNECEKQTHEEITCMDTIFGFNNTISMYLSDDSDNESCKIINNINIQNIQINPVSEFINHKSVNIDANSNTEQILIQSEEEDKKAAEILKDIGNNLLKRRKFNDAINKYTDAINLDPSNAIYFSNRAAAYTELKNYHQAIKDAQMASTLDPIYVKAYIRQAFAEYRLGNYQNAQDAYSKALSLSKPTSKQYKIYMQQINTCQNKLNENKSGKQIIPLSFTKKKQKYNKFQCKLCLKVFKGENNLRIHNINIHTPNDEKPFQCHHCCHGTSSKAALKKHIETHKDDHKKKFNCPQCDIKFLLKGNLTNHLRMHHQMIIKSDKHKCDICKREFGLKQNLELHIITIHNNGNDELAIDTSVSCKYCSFVAGSKKLLQKHEITHFNKNCFKCYVCSKSFKHKSSLRHHMKNTHSKNNHKPFKCSKCGHVTKTKQGLKQHEWSHQGEKSFQCGCLKMFANSEQLTKHLLTHL
eukprot:367394_1